MRFVFLTFVFIVTVTSTARARLGETPDQLVARYGQPLSHSDQKGMGDKIPLTGFIFQKGGFEINVTISDGICVLESYKKINGRPLSTGEIQTMLTINSQGFGWEAPEMIDGEKKWTRDDGATAKFDQDGALTIRAKELLSKEAVAKKLEHNPSLDGF